MTHPILNDLQQSTTALIKAAARDDLGAYWFSRDNLADITSEIRNTLGVNTTTLDDLAATVDWDAIATASTILATRIQRTLDRMEADELAAIDADNQKALPTEDTRELRNLRSAALDLTTARHSAFRDQVMVDITTRLFDDAVGAYRRRYRLGTRHHGLAHLEAAARFGTPETLTNAIDRLFAGHSLTVNPAA